MDPIYDPNAFGSLQTGLSSNSQSSETLICDSNSSTLTHNQSKTSATKQRDQSSIHHGSTADRQNANTELSSTTTTTPAKIKVPPVTPPKPQMASPPSFQPPNINRTSSGSEGNSSSDSGYHQMSSGTSDDSLPPPPPGLDNKLSPSPEPPNGNLQIDCDYDTHQEYGHEGYDIDSAFSDSMSLPSSGSHISVTTTASGSSMGSSGITNSPTPVSNHISTIISYSNCLHLNVLYFRRGVTYQRVGDSSFKEPPVMDESTIITGID